MLLLLLLLNVVGKYDIKYLIFKYYVITSLGLSFRLSRGIYLKYFTSQCKDAVNQNICVYCVFLPLNVGVGGGGVLYWYGILPLYRRI